MKTVSTLNPVWTPEEAVRLLARWISDPIKGPVQLSAEGPAC